MKEVMGSVEIDAPVAQVWEAVMDFATYSEWNPFMVEMSGELKVGSVYDAVTRVPGRKDMRFPSKVTEMKQHDRLVLRGTQIKGLFWTDHSFNFEQVGPNKTKFCQNIVFKGILVPFAGGRIKDVQKGLDQMNEALKARCEVQIAT